MSDTDDYDEVPQENLFRLFENRPNWREAERQLKAACIEAAEKITAIQDKYSDCGAGDTDVRDAITNFIWELLLYGSIENMQEHKKWAERVLRRLKNPEAN